MAAYFILSEIYNGMFFGYKKDTSLAEMKMYTNILHENIKGTNPIFTLCEYLKVLFVTCVYGQHKILLECYFMHIFMVNFSSAQ